MAWSCNFCDRQFGSPHAARQHMGDTNHWESHECETCNWRYTTEAACNIHMNNNGHWAPKFECEACNKCFHTHNAASSHMNQAGHWRNNWCSECQRGFQNANNLRQHLNGSAHRSGSICCPFCKQPHTTASGVVHHVETGSCPRARNLNREFIFKQINAMDTRGAITNKQLTWHDSENSSFIASEASYNGYSYECYMCHRDFKSLVSLNQHLASPAHKQSLYHCFGRGCVKQFTALAALFNHLESESCGAMRFNAVQQNAHGILTGRRAIAF